MDNFKDYENAEFDDERLSKRLAILLDQLAGNPSASISAACHDPYQAKAAYRFVSNDEVTTEAITKITHDVTVGKINDARPPVLLIAQDTTEVNYSSLKETEGLGTIGRHKTALGIHVHSAVAIGETGEVFGLLAQKLWIRPVEEFGKSDSSRYKLAIEEKESYRWLETLEKVGTCFPHGTSSVHICDREGDIFELFFKAQEEGHQYLCRRSRVRSVLEESGLIKLDELIESLPAAGTITVHIPRDSHKKRKERDAKVEIKFGKGSIKKPRGLVTDKEMPKYIEVYFISAVEAAPEPGQEALSWQLITNVPTTNFDEAVTRISWYTQRWKIETFHRTLKSGCKVEELQSNDAKKLTKLIAIYSILALQIMLLSYAGRVNPDVSCEIYLTEDEWKILYRVAKKTKELPEKPPTIKEAVVMIAKLGGFLGRKSDGDPGVTVMWRGLAKLYTILDASLYLI